MDNQENIKVADLLAKGVEQLIIRKGDALPLHHPRNTVINGTISAPGKFIGERNKDFEVNQSHALVSSENKQVK